MTPTIEISSNKLWFGSCKIGIAKSLARAIAEIEGFSKFLAYASSENIL